MTQKTHKLLWVTLVALVSLTVGTSYWQPKLTYAHGMCPQELIPWRTNWNTAQIEAQKSGKPMFVCFTASWCGVCEGMKAVTWTDPQVKASLNGYVPVRINVDQHPNLAKKYVENAVPVLAIIKADGTLVRKVDHGFDPAGFLQWIKG